MQVQNLSHVRAIAAGCEFSIALLEDGEVMTWGSGLNGDLGDGSTEPSDVPVRVGIEHVEAIGAGIYHGLAIVGGKVWGWGSDSCGQIGPKGNSHVPEEVGVGEAVRVAGGECFTTVLVNGGGVKSLGGDFWGELGDGRATYYNPTAVTTPVSGVTAIAAGGQHALALVTGGRVETWGYMPFGHWDEDVERPEEVPITGATAIAAGMSESVVAANGRDYSIGSNTKGSLGTGSAIGPQHEGGVPGYSWSETPAEVVGLEAPTNVAGMATLANAPAPMLYTFNRWALSGSLTSPKVGTIALPPSTVSGRAALHGQIRALPAIPEFTAPLKLFGQVAVDFSLTLSFWQEVEGDVDPSGLHANTGLYVAVNSVGILGLKIPTNCETTEAAPFTVSGPDELPAKMTLSGSGTMPRFACHGGFLGTPFGKILSALWSGSENSLTLTAEP